MIWLTLRQHRWELVVSAVVVVLVAGVNLIEGLRASAMASELGLASCANVPFFVGPVSDNPCSIAIQQFEREFGWMGPFRVFFVVLPAMVAPLLAAPLLAREYEFRTTLLVWAQSLTRVRWLVVKVGLFAGVLAAGAIVFAIVAPIAEHAWSYRPMRWQDAFEWSLPVTLGTTLLAVGLGVFCGALTRRILASMLIALVLVTVVRGGVATQLRPYYLPPVVATGTRDVLDDARRHVPPDAWQVGGYYVDTNGHVVPNRRVDEIRSELFKEFSRRPLPRPYTDPDRYVRELGIFLQVPYQPREREGLFQAIELGVYSALALALFAASLWLVRRRPA